MSTVGASSHFALHRRDSSLRNGASGASQLEAFLCEAVTAAWLLDAGSSWS